MSTTAHKTEEEKIEYFDTEEELDQKVDLLAQLIENSRHFIVFTGAGISTSTGVPDFRSGVNTVLPTGPGAWEKAATNTYTKPTFRKSTASAIPSPTHMALVRLQEAGYLKYLISQNTDGLHRKSGFPYKHLAELHGNTNLEICKNKQCMKEYSRDFRVRTNPEVHRHETGRKCENCGGELFDTIVNFGESLPQKELYAGFEHAEKADLCLVLGSSLRVTPAANMPKTVGKNGGTLVIVNLQATPLDDYALGIHGLIDDVMGRLMYKLGLEIPPFVLKRRVMVTKKVLDKNGKTGIVVRGVDATGSPYSLLKGIKMRINETKETFANRGGDPFVFSPKINTDKGTLKLSLEFQGHYGEPVLDLDVPLESLGLDEPIYYLMEFDPQIGIWVDCNRTIVDPDY